MQDHFWIISKAYVAYLACVFYNGHVRYPYVCASIAGVWLATLAVLFFNIVEPTIIYIYASVTVLILFFLGFARG